MRLSTANLGLLPSQVQRFSYDRLAQKTGIVHLGIGAFHRAHQAWYTDLAMDAGERDWAIEGVSLRSADVAAQLNPQDGLYTVTERSREGSHTRLVGAVRSVAVATENAARVAKLLAAAETRIVSLTVTEKGYCRGADGALDFALAGDGSIYRFLAEALRQRHQAKLAGLTLLSCDNLAGNGEQLQRLVSEYLEHKDRPLAAWFERECACPSTMVDRIVPATTSGDRAELAQTIGLEDAAAVVTEPFSQWVIEDRFAAGRPAWERVGAQLVSNVAPFEAAKLRMLNGAHSALAYLGLLRGHTFVHEAVADLEIRPTVERLMRQEAAPSLIAAPGQNLARYADALLERFANPALNHRLSQIAMDGSQKVPQRWLETLAFHSSRGQDCPALLTAVAAWLRHVRGDNGPVDDPRARDLAEAWSVVGTAGIVDAVFGSAALIASDWTPGAQDRRIIENQLH